MNFISYFVSINIVGFVVMLIDKKKAIYHRWRIAEDTLLVVALLGGCFGMLMGMYLFHHKTKKWKFKLVPVICFIWLVILWYW